MNATLRFAALTLGVLAAVCPARADTFTVTNTAASGPGSLNDTLNGLLYGSTNTIAFDIPGPGVHTILVASTLYVPSGTTIDGYTQPGAQPNTLTNGDNAVLRVELRGVGANVGLNLSGGGCTVRGLVMNGFGSDAISLTANGANTVIRGNFFGTDPSGTVAEGNEYDGVFVQQYGAAGTVFIGGATPADRNVISGNHYAGVDVGSSAGTTVVQGNFIGTDITGARPLGNPICGVVNFGNGGVLQVGGTNAADANVIAFNGVGVWNESGQPCSALGNSIFANQGLGLDVGASGGGSTVQPPAPGGFSPVITSVSVSGGSTTVHGTLQGETNAAYRVEFFANAGLDAIGFGQGRAFLGFKDVTTGANGSASFAAIFAGTNQFLAATATDPAGNTSEFSPNYETPAASFAVGDLLIGLENGLVQWRHADGTLVAVLNPGFGWNNTLGGMAFDRSGNLCVTGQSNSTVVRFSPSGQPLGVFATNVDGTSSDLAFDAAGHAYVAANYASSEVGEFDANGNLLAEFNPDAQLSGISQFQLGADQRTAYFDGFINLFFSTEYLPYIERYDLPAQQSEPLLYLTSTNLNAPGLYGFRLLADGGAVLSGDSGLARVSINPAQPLAPAQVTQTYHAPGEDSWGPIALDADGRSFWAGGYSGPFVHKFDLASGAMVARIDTGVSSGIASLAVFGGPVASTAGMFLGIAPGSGSAVAGQFVTNALTLLNFHTNALTGVTVTDRLSVGNWVWISASTSLGTVTTANGKVTFNLDTVPAGTNVTLSVVFLPGSPGTLTNFATASATGPVAETHPVSAVLTILPRPGSLVVTNTADSGAGSLRAAIQAANAAGGGVITFNIPGSGTHVIQPLSPLPALTAPVTIDGYSQPGAAPNTSATADNATVTIALNGAGAGPLADGLVLAGGNSLVRGLAIYSFSGNGLVLTGGDGDVITGNFIGAAATGAAAPNGRNGVLISDSLSDTIGGASAAARNLISANSGSGIGITGNYTGGAAIENNFIGVGRLGTTALGNGLDGVLVSASDVMIGGTNAGDGNVIAFNAGAGVSVFGTTYYGQYSTETPQFTDGVGIPGNSIFGNGQLGIDMAPAGVTPNGPQDSRTGPDGALNFPVLAPITPGSASVQGTLDAYANESYRIEIFGNAAPDPSGYGQGAVFLGAASVVTDGNGLASFSVPVSPALTNGEFVTATAVALEDFDTSEFSLAVRVAPAADLAVSIAASPNPATARQNLTYTITVTNHGPGAADDVLLTNQTPVYTSFVSADGGGTTTYASPPQVIWALGALAAGASTNLHVVVTPTRVGTITASANVSALEADPSPANNAASLSVTVSGPPRTLTVTTTADSGAGSLRDAINNVNVNGYGLDTIQFNIPGSGVQTINLLSDLPAITEPVTIDGYTQPGAQPNTLAAGDHAVLRIQLQETNYTYSSLLWLAAGNSTVRGLVVNGVGSRGIYVSANYGSPPQTNVVITGNFIGASPSGTAAATNDLDAGIEVDGNSGLSGVQIGGPSPADRNVISGNGGTGSSTTSAGVWVNGADNVVIQGNYIGADASGQTPLGNNGDGVMLYLNDNGALIGGTNAGDGNVIANNATIGVQIGGGTNNAVLGNSIFNNGGLGLHLGFAYANDPGSPTPNDLGDADTGPNDLQNYPVLTSVSVAGGDTTVAGALNSAPNTTYRLEFFSNARPDLSFYGAGQTLLGAASVTTDAGGNASFSFTFAGAGSNVTATATDPFGNTSEFSAAVLPSADAFQTGDLFIGSADGVIQWRRNDGTPVKLLNAGGTNGVSALAFDPAGRLVAAIGNALVRFDNHGNLLGVLATNVTARDIAFDAAGNFYVTGGGYTGGSGSGPIWKFSSSGHLLNTFSAAGDSGAPGYLDLAADQHTIYYTSGGAAVERFDAATQSQLADLTANLSAANIYGAYGVRLLADGSVLVAGGSGQDAVRLDSAGNVLRTYAATNASGDLTVVALDPDGQSFWVSTYFNPSYLYKFNLASGANVLQLPTFLPGGDGTSVGFGSFAIYGEPRVAAPPLPLLTISPSAKNVVVSWPASFAGFTLQATPTLSPPRWSNLTSATNWVSLPATNAERFFRLVKP